MTGAGRAPRVVVVGSGIAGLTAALEARAAGADTVVLTKTAADASNTRFAQGGIAAVTTQDDSLASHEADTLTAGGGHADPDAVRALVAGGPAAIAALEARGAAFDREAGGERLRGREGAHSVPRILHAGGDATGAEIQRALLAECAASGVDVREGAFVTDVIVDRERAVGVGVLAAERRRAGRGTDGATRAAAPDRDRTAAAPPGTRPTGRPSAAEPRRAFAPPRPDVLPADAVVLATGGLGQAYAATTNPAVATGDGVAIALRAGAAVRDMEFVQFHPTVLAAGEPFLVSEAVRGEGAVLRDERGRRFAFDAHPDGELAPRDVVARAIARVMVEQGGRPALLDATALGAAFLARRFPTIDRAVRERGLDWARHPIPVAPAAHYAMGGVETDLDGRTRVPGLFAAGETARTGAHGANRLASNSLLEGAVFGGRAGRAAALGAAAPHGAARAAGRGGHAAAFAPGTTAEHNESAAAAPRRASLPVPPGYDPRTAADAPGTRSSVPAGGRGATPPAPYMPNDTYDERPAFSRRALQELMQSRAGLVRDAAGLAEAARTIASWRAAAPAPRTAEEHEGRNLLDVAAAIVRAAAARTASLGAHWRADDTGAPPARTPEPVMEAAC